MKRRVWSTVLCLCLILTLLPTAAAADAAGSVTVCGAAITLTTPYYYAATGRATADAGDGSWNAHLTYDSGRDVYALELKDLTVHSDDADVIVARGINALYLQLTGVNTITTNEDSASKAIVNCTGIPLTINGSGSLNGTSEFGMGIKASSITLQSHAVLTLTCGGGGATAAVVYEGNCYALSANIAASSSGAVPVYNSSTEYDRVFTTYHYLNFALKPDPPFPISIGNTRITLTNMGDVLGDGTVRYTPARGFSSAVLSLNGADVNGGRYTSYFSALYCEEPLRLTLAGTNRLFAANSTAAVCGIYVSGDLTIDGIAGASLTAGGRPTVPPSASTRCYGVYTGGRLTISGAALDATAMYTNGTGAGIYAKNGISVTGASVTADCLDGDWALKTGSGGSLSLTGCFLRTPAGGGWSDTAHGLVDSDGQPANRVVLDTLQPVSLAAIGGVTPPTPGQIPVTGVTETDQYTGTVVWTPDGALFGYSTAYTATITLAPKPGYTLTGISENFFTVAGAATANGADSGVITALFPATGGVPYYDRPAAYPVTLSAPAEGGTVSVSPGSASAGTKVTITPKPDEGRQVGQITVTDSSGNPVPVTENADGTYSFLQPSGGAAVSVSFQNRAWVNPFSDVRESDWFCGDVQYVFERGLMTGTSDTAFSPVAATTRGMTVTILWRMAGSPVVNYAMAFTDVSGDAYHGEAVRWAAASGIAGGYGNGSFGPDDPITREQLAAILYRFAQYMKCDTAQGGTSIREFADYERISPYAAEAMAWAVSAGLLQGDNNNLMPQGSAARAQAAAILHRFCESIAG